MKKTVDVLHFRGSVEGTYTEQKQSGYLFEAVTQDGEPITLFVYKLNGFWHANETECKAMITTNPQRTRENAMFEARYKIKTMNYARYSEYVRRLKAGKTTWVKLEEEEVMA